MDFTFDFTGLGPEPIELLAAPAPGHPPTILPRTEQLLPIRYQPLAD